MTLETTEEQVNGEEAEESLLEMDPKEMRRWGYRVVDMIVDRWLELPDNPSWGGGTRRELEALLSESAPESPVGIGPAIERLQAEVFPRAGQIDHPRFFAFVPSSPTWPSVLADFLTSGFNSFQGTWLESAGPSQIELVVVDWFREWLGFPQGAGGLLTSGGSAANLIALVTAREAVGNPERGLVYLSDQGHSSLERAAWIAGVSRDAVRKVPTDEGFRMIPAELRRMLEADRRDGYVPIAVCANAGATNTGAIDALGEIGGICRESETWFHIDAAYGGFAILTDRGQALFDGLEKADSVTLDPHKWLFQPFEAGSLVVRDVRRLEDAFRILPEYLQDTELGLEEVNFANRGIQLTRRFRALKVWMSVQAFGLDAFRKTIARAMEYADRLGAIIKESPVFEQMSPPSLGVVCYRFNPPDAGLSEEELSALNARIQDRIVESGFAMVSSTRLRERYALRFCIMNHRSTWQDVEGTFREIERTAKEVYAE